MTLEYIENKLKGILHPPNFVKTFKDKEEFTHWLKLGSIEDLQNLLAIFEQEEMFEYCILIKKEIEIK